MYVPRGKLLALITIVVAAALVTGSGAFSSASVERTASVQVTGDESAYLGLVDEGKNSVFSDTEDGKLSINFDNAGGDVGGEGVNPDSKYSFDGVFTIVNQGTQEVDITVKEGDEKKITFYDSETGESIDGTRIGTGDDIKVGVEINAEGKGEGTDFDEDFTIEAVSPDTERSVAGESGSSGSADDSDSSDESSESETGGSGDE